MYLIHGLTRADCHDIIEGLRLLQKAKPDETATGEERQITDERIDELCSGTSSSTATTFRVPTSWTEPMPLRSRSGTSF